LRAPLTHLHGFSTLLLENHGARLDQDGQRYLSNIKNGVLRMSALIDDLLMLAKVSRQGLQLRDVALNALVQEVLREFESDTHARDIEWRIEALPLVKCDPGLIRQVFINLLSNAVKYTRKREHAVIEIGGKMVDGEQTILVRDNGIGFDMKYADKLFAPFQRLHQENEFEGTGVGLSTVQRIIHKHAGRIWAESEPGLGTTVYFTLDVETGRAAEASVLQVAKV
jgi:light-regulated signal transduction histidine kinase (bacteriophytochrome)